MLVSLVFVALTGLASSMLPYSRTAASELSVRGLEHREVLRIGRDFGKRNMKVVVDAWVPSAEPAAIDEVRFWWLDTDNADERSPFGRKLRKYIGIDFLPNEPGDWTVKLRGDRKEFAFEVEVDERGEVWAYGNVLTEQGDEVRHCRALDSRFVARRFLGIPVGIKRLEVRCVDEDGHTREGELAFRKLPRGKLWDDG